MTTPMNSIEVTGPLRLFDAAVAAVQDLGVLHVEEIPLANDGDPGRFHRIRLSEEQLREKEELEALLRMQEDEAFGIPSRFSKSPEATEPFVAEYEKWSRERPSAILAASRLMHSRIKSFIRRERNLEDDLRVLASYEDVAGALAPFLESRDIPEGYEFLGIILEKGNRLAGRLLRDELRSGTGGQYRFYGTGFGGGRTAVLAGYPKSRSGDVRKLVERIGISEMSFPRYLRNRPFEEALAALEEDLTALREKRRALREQIEGFYRENGMRLLAMRAVCRDLLNRYETIGRFARTEYAFVMRGWIRREDIGGLTAALREKAGNTVLVSRIRSSDLGAPPVVLRNPRPFDRFETLIGFLPLPKYGTVDPTMFVALFFPPMYGLMLGDIGYGLLLGILAFALYRRGRTRPVFKSLSVITAFCAVFTTGFGFVFGEFFGDAGHALGLKPLWRERFSLTEGDLTGALFGYLAIAVGVGVFHILTGLVLGMISARRTKNVNGLLAAAGRFTGLFVLFFFTGRLVDFLPPVFTSLAVAGLVVFLAVMIALTFRHPAHGLLLPLEVLSTVGNILSYARIMAIGLASVVLALLANLFAGMVGNIVLAIVIVVLVHALNLTLGILDPTIQGMRLQYVEFFSKFYVGGGKSFTPFRKAGGTFV